MRYRITKDIKLLTCKVAFMIVREPMNFLNKPLKTKMTPWKIRRCETLVAMFELYKMLEKDWFKERMQLARIKLEENEIIIRKEEKEILKTLKKAKEEDAS